MTGKAKGGQLLRVTDGVGGGGNVSALTPPGGMGFEGEISGSCLEIGRQRDRNSLH